MTGYTNRMSSQPSPSQVPSPSEEPQSRPASGWRTVVHNDPINLMTYVEWVFRSYFGMTYERASRLMMQVHETGRAVVSQGAARANGSGCTGHAPLWTVGNDRGGRLMLGFHPERGGYVAQADPTERRLVRGLAADVVTMLGLSVTDILGEREARKQAAFDDDAPALDPLAQYESELADLADLELRIAEESEVGGADSDEELARIPMDDAIARLLPDMSEDPELARELRSMTQDALAVAKAENLATFYASLEGENDVVWVANDDAASWLAASNDIRLVLAARLEIVDDSSSEAVYKRASYLTGEEASQAGREVETQDDLLAVLYAMLTWWQESLLHAVGIKARRR